MIPLESYGETLVPYDKLPRNAKYALMGRVTIDGKVYAVVPLGHTAPLPAPRGGGFVALPETPLPGTQNPNSDVIRVMPPGTGSSNPKNPNASQYPNGYTVFHNSAGQPISLYSGKPVPMSKAHVPVPFDRRIFGASK